MDAIYDVETLAVGEARTFELGERMINVRRGPDGAWRVDAGGTDVATIRRIADGDFVVSEYPSESVTATPLDFAAALRRALERVGG